MTTKGRHVTCDWCRWRGEPMAEVELVGTPLGTRRRCVDRDACRERAATALAVAQASTARSLAPTPASRKTAKAPG